MLILKKLLIVAILLNLSTSVLADDKNKSLIVSGSTEIINLVSAINTSMYNPPYNVSEGSAQWTMDPQLVDKNTLIASTKPTYESVVFMMTLLEFYIEESSSPKNEEARSNNYRSQAINNAIKVLDRLRHITTPAFVNDYQKLLNKIGTNAYHLANSSLRSHIVDAIKKSKENKVELSTNLSTTTLMNIKKILFDVTAKDGAFPSDTLTQSRIQKINNILVAANDRIVREAKRREYLKSLSVRFPKNSKDLKESLSKFKKILESQFIGQPETIEALISMRRSALIRGQEMPRHIVAMGEPGSGKDTAAMAFTDAIHNEAGAYKDHMYSLDVMKNQSDLWKVFGSATGYVGSEGLPPFLKFLVEHSGGRYLIEEEIGRNGTQYSIVENDAWQLGQDIEEGTYAPHEAVVFVNEFHNWSKDMKDAVLKIALQEDSYFPVNNPKGGVSKLYVPVNIVIATNNGIELLSSRDVDGNRFGAPLKYTDRIKRWEISHSDKAALKISLSAQNGTGYGQLEKGISEELLNRLQNIVLMRPHSPETMVKISSVKTKSLGRSFSKGMLSNLTLEFSQSVHRFLVDYDFSSEDGMRFVNDKIIKFIEDPLNRALDTEDLRIPEKKTTWLLDFKKNEDLTTRLEVKIMAGKKTSIVNIDLPSTEKDRLREVLPQERIEEIIALEKEINSKVFGVSHIVPQLIESAIETEEKLNEKVDDEYKDGKKANVMMFLGKSSTGKTYLAETYGELKHGDKSKVVTIDFSQISTKEALNKLVLGEKDERGRSIPSKFMQEYDRANGKITFIFDEVANTHPEILKSLYDVLRQSVVTTFSDNKERSMAGVDIIMTGNAGEEIYNQIPESIPDNQRLAAMNKAYDNFMSNAGIRRGILEKFFSDAFLNRVGERNIFFFGPLSYKSLREVTQLKTDAAFRSLSKAGNGKKSWDIQIASAQDLENLYEIIERAGFIIDEQGASIDKFVSESIEAKLRSLLIKNGVKTGSTVTLKTLTTEPKITEKGVIDFSYDIAVFIEKSKSPLILKINGKERPANIKTRKTDQTITAYHEAGHELARKVLLGFDSEHEEISIVPGITSIGNSIVHYRGIARSLQKFHPKMTREYAIREIAVLAAGYIAETMVTEGARHASGKANDMLRAAHIAKNSVAKWGLSESFGTLAIGPEETIDSFYSKLSEEKKKIFQEEVDELINEGIFLAREALTVNESAFIKMGLELAEKGTLTKTDLNRFYEKNNILIETDDSYLKKAEALESEIESNETNAENANKVQSKSRVKRRRTLLELKGQNYVPSEVANIDELILKEKQTSVADVLPSKSIRIATTDNFNVDGLATDIKIKSESSNKSNQANACVRALN